MSWMNPHGQRALDLRAYFNFCLLWVGMLVMLPVMVEVSVLVEQTRNLIFGCNRAPAVVDSFARHGQVQSEVGVGMRLCVIGHLREPRTGDHDAGGIDGSSFHGFSSSGVHSMGFSQVVGVNNN